MKRQNFAFRFQWHEAIAHLDPESRLEIYEQTIAYAMTGEACFKSGIAAVAFNKHILPDFERRRKAAEYRARIRNRRREMAEQADAHARQIEEIVQPVAPPPPMPVGNRRERRRAQALEKRLMKKRLRNSRHGSHHPG